MAKHKVASEKTAKKKYKVKSPYNWLGLITAGLLTVVCFTILFAILSGNALYAVDHISTTPAQVVVYYKGETLTFEPDDPEYERLVEACYTTLVNEQGFVEWGWSEKRYEQARGEGVAVELLYSEPVRLPGNRLDISHPTRLFFPLQVFGFKGEVVFRGGRLQYWGRPLRVDTLDRVRQAVDEIMAARQTGWVAHARLD